MPDVLQDSPRKASQVTLSEWLIVAKPRLEIAGLESPALEAQMLAAHILRVDRPFVLTHPEHEFPELAGELVLQRRERHEPLAYILGWREFYGRRFEVGPAVLIPRHETETLVETALEFLRLQTVGAPDISRPHPPPSLTSQSEGWGPEPVRLLDVGTGSGCLAITIKLECAGVEVTGVDISPGALEIAERNASALGADVRFVLSDGFKALDGEVFDLIVTNPPYIGLDEELPSEVRDYEPGSALFSGPTGLEFYEMLARDAAEFLREDGRLLMEVGYRQAHDVSLIFESTGWLVDEVRQDLSGIDRVVVVRPLSV